MEKTTELIKTRKSGDKLSDKRDKLNQQAKTDASNKVGEEIKNTLDKLTLKEKEFSTSAIKYEGDRLNGIKVIFVIR